MVAPLTHPPPPETDAARLTVDPSAGQHYVLLYMKEGTRSYQVRDDEAAVLDALMRLCEADMARKRGVVIDDQANPPGGARDVPTGAVRAVQYDAGDLMGFVDGALEELVVLRYDPLLRGYMPQGREWAKSRLFRELAATCAGPSGATPRETSVPLPPDDGASV